MDLERMRSEISKLYPGVAWKDRCAKMEPRQVIAIFLTSKRRGAFDKRTKEARKVKERNKEEYHQMTLFEVFGYEFANGKVKTDDGHRDRDQET